MPTFDAVVEAAERVLSEHGIEGLTTNRVAEIAGVSIGSLYQYFPNKEAIVSALIERYLQRVTDVFETALAKGTSFDDICQRVAAEMLTLTAERVVFAHLKVLRTAAGANERIGAHLDAMVTKGAIALQRLGLASAHDATSLAYVIIHTGDGMVNAIAQSTDVNVLEVTMIYFDMIRRYVGSLRGAR